MSQPFTKKNLRSPEESIALPGITEDMVEIGGFTVSRAVTIPGWRWSEHTRPLVGGEWCEARHIGVVVSGSWAAELRDGSVLEFGPDDVYDVPPGHDGYTVGDEPCVLIEWSGMRALAGSYGEFHDRVLATLLFTDIVESTATILSGGDTAWRDLLAMHHGAMRAGSSGFEVARSTQRETACSPPSTPRRGLSVARPRSGRAQRHAGSGSLGRSYGRGRSGGERDSRGRGARGSENHGPGRTR